MSWIVYAIAGALASAVAGTLAKAGLERMPPALATAISSVVVALATAAFAAMRGDVRSLGEVDRRAWVFLVCSGVATAAAYVLYFRALKSGEAARVQPLDRLSLVFAVILAIVFLKEKPNAGLVAGTALMAIGAAVIAFTAAR
jgi:bacterial/archaeal transporter family protein